MPVGLSIKEVKEIPSHLINFKIGSRRFLDASIPDSISSFATLTRSQLQDSVSRTKTELSSILKREPRFQKYLADFEDLSAILIKSYQRAADNVKTFADLIRTRTGISSIALDIKKPESAVKKLIRQQIKGKWKTAEEVNDILRATIIVKNKEEARAMVKKLGDVVHKFDDYFDAPKIGYRGINVEMLI